MEKIIKTLIIGNGYWGNILKKNIEKHKRTTKHLLFIKMILSNIKFID